MKKRSGDDQEDSVTRKAHVHGCTSQAQGAHDGIATTRTNLAPKWRANFRWNRAEETFAHYQGTRTGSKEENTLENKKKKRKRQWPPLKHPPHT